MIVAGTGHRPNKLGGYSDEAFDLLVDIAIEYLQEFKPDKVISGMALGWDTALAYASLTLEIPYICAIPFKGQETMWPEKSQRLYKLLLSESSSVVYVCDDGFANYKMQKRNEWMVDNCDILLAMHDGSVGGTNNCIKYAVKNNKKIVNLYPKYESKN